MNWPQIISDLLAAGETETSIAKTIGSSQGAINRYKTGTSSDPAHTLGERLLDLHKEKVLDKAATPETAPDTTTQPA